MYKLIDGKSIAEESKLYTKERVTAFENEYGRKITLAVILVGDNPASQVYVKNKIKSAEFVGIKSLSFTLPKESTQADVENLIQSLAEDKSVDGILVQLPLPEQLNTDRVLSKIPSEKDVDGFLPENVGNLVLGKDCTVACTPYGIIKMLKHENIELSGKNAVIIGRSNIVGKPMALLLLAENCTVTVCHSKTANICEYTKNADIIVVAIGKPLFLKENMVKDGAVVIDVGINRTNNGLVGDVDFENVSKKCSFITPVPGGVGPMTIATLMENTVNVAFRRENCK